MDAQLFDIRNIDLPRKVKYRPRYKKPEFKVDRGCRIKRSYADFQKYLGANPETTIVQMDSVIGRVGGMSSYHTLCRKQSHAGFFAGRKYISLCNRDHKLIG